MIFDLFADFMQSRPEFFKKNSNKVQIVRKTVQTSEEIEEEKGHLIECSPGNFAHFKLHFPFSLFHCIRAHESLGQFSIHQHFVTFVSRHNQSSSAKNAANFFSVSQKLSDKIQFSRSASKEVLAYIKLDVETGILYMCFFVFSLSLSRRCVVWTLQILAGCVVSTNRNKRLT